VHEGTWTVNTTDNVGHTSLVTTESGKVAFSFSVILREVTDATEVTLGTLLRQETQVTTARSFEFTVRPIL
jgi:hypothetical protein